MEKFTDEQQALVDKLVGEARTKSREQATAEFEAKAAQAKEQAERDALAANSEWQALAKKHEARVKELEAELGAAMPELTAQRELITKEFKAQVKTLSDVGKQAVKSLPETMSDLDKLAWLRENADLFQAQTDQTRGTPVAPQRSPGKQKFSGHKPVKT